MYFPVSPVGGSSSEKKEENSKLGKTERVVCVSHSVMPGSANPWTVACQVPLSMELSRQEYWNGLPFYSPGDLPDPGIKPRSPALQADFLTV